MWWIYVLSAVFILFLIFNVRIRFLVGYDEKPSVILRILFFKLDLLNRKKKKKKKGKEEKKARKKERLCRKPEKGSAQPCFVGYSYN